MVIAVVAIVIAATAGALASIRTATHDADRWHVDPLTAPSPSSPNSYRVGPAVGEHGATVEPDAVAPVVRASVEQLAEAFDAVALASPRVEVVAGSAADGHVTYVQRSATIGYPDYVSVRFISTGDGSSTLAAFSRARFGYSDLGVNRKRLSSWVDQTTARLA